MVLPKVLDDIFIVKVRLKSLSKLENVKKSTIFNVNDSQKEFLLKNLFSEISPTYDFTNTILSCKSDLAWRRHAVKISGFKNNDKILDLCAGTGEMTLIMMKHIGCNVTLADFSSSMLDIAEKKLSNAGFSNLTQYVETDIKNLPFNDHVFDGAVLAFSLRNLPCLDKTLKEIQRVLVPGGKLILLELTKPNNIILRKIYYFYLNNILPTIGGFISKKFDAYNYLAQSIQAFYEPKEFVDLLSSLNFINVKYHSLSLGIASIFSATCPP